jgi:glycolate oxidase FAD binding subunit
MMTATRDDDNVHDGDAMTTLLDDLAAIVGGDHVIAAPEACAGFAVHGVVPECVVAPGTLEELSAVMRVAHEHRALVAAWGGGTRQRIGGAPPHLDLVVRTARLDRVIQHEPNDLTIAVEAGMTLGALRAHLARHGQMLPLDPPLAEQATIGGLIATAADGPRRLGYGTLRDLLIGITVVEADGRVSRAGGMVVKNVSGFDMMKLYLGSYGTLALIASANFKLLPIPRAAGSLLAVFHTPAQAFAAVATLAETQLTPTAVEFLNGGALQMVATEQSEDTRTAVASTSVDPAPSSIDRLSSGRSMSSVANDSCGLLVRAEGLPLAVERHLADVVRIAESAGAIGVTRLEGPDERNVWTRVADLPQCAVLAEGEAVLKLAVLPAETERAIERLEQLAQETSASLTISARALNGVLYARVGQHDVTRLARFVAGAPGVQWVATDAADVPRWGALPQGEAVMRRIKREFDPHGRLNPGRFVVEGDG